jgi:hypothetical protein
MGWTAGVRYSTESDSETQPAHCSMGTGYCFPGDKAATEWSWPLTSNWCRCQENVDLYIHFPIRLHGAVKFKVTLRLTVSQSVSLGIEPHLGLMTRYLAITIWQLWSCFCGAPSLTRGRVCLLYMLLGLPNAVFLGSESFGTRDHILLSQIWDFTFRRLLRLAGSRWRYSTPPPHGFEPAAPLHGVVLN